MIRRNDGFTLIELLITVAVGAIITVIALPSYRTTIDSSNVASEINALQMDLTNARMEAIKQGINVLVCSSSNGLTCTGASPWTTGWITMIPASGTCTVASGTSALNNTPLRVHAAVATGDAVTFVPTSPNTSQAICFSRLGTGSIGTFRIVSSKGSTAPNQFNDQCLFVTGFGLPHLIAYGKTDSIGTC